MHSVCKLYTKKEQGIRVFVDLNVANKFCAFNLLGVPKGWSAFCTRGYEDRLNGLNFEYEIAKRIADGNNLTFVVYGGGEVIKQWCKEHGAVYVTPIIIIKNKYKSIQRMAQNTALFKEKWDMGKAIPTLKDLLDKQVIDNRKQIEHEV